MKKILLQELLQGCMRIQSPNFAYTTQKSIHNSVDTGACRSARTLNVVYCKPAINLTEYTKKQYSRLQKIGTPTENVYDTAGYENAKPLGGKKGTYTHNLLRTAGVPLTLGEEVRKN